MRLSIHAIGRLKQGPERELVGRYLERAVGTGRPLALVGFDIAEFPESRAGNAQTRKADEARLLAASLADGSVVVALDERGKAIGSEAFAGLIGHSRATFSHEGRGSWRQAAGVGRYCASAAKSACHIFSML